jgi:large subunit ribosomal protein L4
MATIDIFDINKNRVGEIEISDTVFNAEVKEYLIHEAVKIQLANRRAGTVAVKNRAAVAVSGKKPFKQKGTGQARQGFKGAPQYYGGGVAFGPQPKTYDLRMNKKARKAALRSILSLLYKENKLTVLNKIDLPGVSTKNFAQVLNGFEANKALIVVDEFNRNLELSARNIRDIKVLNSEGINPFDMMKYQKLILTEASIRKIEGALQS